MASRNVKWMLGQSAALGLGGYMGIPDLQMYGGPLYMVPVTGSMQEFGP
jgi:hypothetical protein